MKLKKGEKGFTLIELLVAMSIAALVTGAASMTIITMMRLIPQTNNWAVALRQVQDAGYWISLDVLMADNITIGTGNPTFLTLTQPQITPPDKTIVYQFEDMSGGLKRLMRNDASQQTMIAQFISSMPPPTYNSDNRTLTFTIEATSGSITASQQYQAAQRVPAP